MAIPFLSPLDMNKNELQNARIQNLSADPASPVAGQVYFNTTDLTIREYSGAAWLVIAWVGATAPTAEAVGSTAVVGTAIEASRADHRHAMPGAATNGVDGFMPGADKTKLDAATATNTNSTLVLRDASGRAQFTDPSAAQDAATKSYVDAAINGLDWKASARLATAAAFAITARTSTTLTIGGTTLTVDGVATANGDRVLVKDTPTGTGAGTWDRGLYTVGGIGTSVVLTRALDMDAWAEIPGAAVFVELGSTLADTCWVCSSDQGGTLGTTAVTWVQFGSMAIANSSVTNAMLANMAAATVKGQPVGAATGAPVDLTAAQVKAIVDSVGIFKADFGDGVATTFVIAHGLNTRDVLVDVYRTTTPWETVFCDVERTSTTTVTLRFTVAPTANQFRVVVEA